MKKKLSAHMLSNTVILSDSEISETVLIAVIREKHASSSKLNAIWKWTREVVMSTRGS